LHNTPLAGGVLSRSHSAAGRTDRSPSTDWPSRTIRQVQTGRPPSGRPEPHPPPHTCQRSFAPTPAVKPSSSRSPLPKQRQRTDKGTPRQRQRTGGKKWETESRPPRRTSKWGRDRPSSLAHWMGGRRDVTTSLAGRFRPVKHKRLPTWEFRNGRPPRPRPPGSGL
jgi:hypothetical protein